MCTTILNKKNSKFTMKNKRFVELTNVLFVTTCLLSSLLQPFLRKNRAKKRVTHGRLRGWKQKNTVCPWRPGRRGRAQSLTVRGKSPQRTPLVGSCLPNQGVSSKQGAPLPRRASTEQTVSSPGQLDSARATTSWAARAGPGFLFPIAEDKGSAVPGSHA